MASSEQRTASSKQKKMRNFKDYEIWHLAMDIVIDVYNISEALPDKEKYGLQSQIRRCSVSMPSNIAEGCSRRSDKAFAVFLEISLGSSFELQTQLMIGERTGYFKKEALVDLFERLDKFQRKANSLLSKMER
jgi:four helix bundle protein